MDYKRRTEPKEALEGRKCPMSILSICGTFAVAFVFFSRIFPEYLFVNADFHATTLLASLVPSQSEPAALCTALLHTIIVIGGCTAGIDTLDRHGHSTTEPVAKTVIQTTILSFVAAALILGLCSFSATFALLGAGSLAAWLAASMLFPHGPLGRHVLSNTPAQIALALTPLAMHATESSAYTCACSFGVLGSIALVMTGMHHPAFTARVGTMRLNL
jgi:hypothetical protein